MGTLRDLRGGDKNRPDANSIKAQLFPRLTEFRAQGMGWDKIESTLEQEGYEENGKKVTANALRKRYTKWLTAESSGTPTSESELMSKETPRRDKSDQIQQSRMEWCLRQFEEGAALPAFPPVESTASGIASLVALNSRLLEQVQQSHRMIERLEKRLEMQEQKSSYTGMDETEQPVTSRDLLELLKEITAGRLPMGHFIEEHREDYVHREEILQLLEDRVQEQVDAELKTMLSEEGSFSKELTHLVDQRLKTLFSGGEPVPETAQAGPGRGRKEKTHKKFSASLEETLFERVKSLPGQFSGHLANALTAYLAVMEEKKEH